jgi:glycerol-1-phosphate dehydrogenase [NAD(P)+]
MGVSRELFYQSLLNGHTVRPRYSILQFAHDRGLSETIAQKITRELYGE